MVSTVCFSSDRAICPREWPMINAARVFYYHWLPKACTQVAKHTYCFCHGKKTSLHLCMSNVSVIVSYITLPVLFCANWLTLVYSRLLPRFITTDVRCIFVLYFVLDSKQASRSFDASQRKRLHQRCRCQGTTFALLSLTFPSFELTEHTWNDLLNSFTVLVYFANYDD